MALTAPALAVDLRLCMADSEYAELPEGQRQIVARVLDTASALVDDYAPDAPAAIATEATVRCAGYLYDVAPDMPRMVHSPLRHSGAAALLSRYRARRLVGVSP